MKRYKYIVVVLVYRNADDLVECIESINANISSCRIVVVNAYYDDDSYKRIKSIADETDCDFINIENKGYGYGNNVGINHAKSNYDYEYVIIANPDTIIERFDDSGLKENRIYAPKIVSLRGIAQNPMVVKHSNMSEFMIYQGFKRNIRAFIAIGVLITKFNRALYRYNKESNDNYVYQAHGSFLILHQMVIDRLTPVYDEKMFLFAEEGVLALRAKQANIRTVYTEKIAIKHKEDGSMSIASFDINDKLRESNIYFYETYCK